MSDANSVDELADELGNVVDEALGEDSSNPGFMDELSRPGGDLYAPSQPEDELEGSLAGANTNASDYTEASGSHPGNSRQPGQEAKQEKPETKRESPEGAREGGVDADELGRSLARRGIFSAEELTDETLFTSSGRTHDYQRTRRYQAADTNVKDLNDPGLTDRQCILRLPEHAAELLRRRLDRGEPLGMSVSATGRYDFREYRIDISGLERPLFGVLGELPCVVEAHKTLNSDLLFKSADISQLMVAYEREEADEALEALRARTWEWPDGLTPGTRSIRKRRFKDFEDYTIEEVKEAERESLILMNGVVRDTYHFEVKTAQEVSDLVQNYRNGNIKERVIGPDEDVAVYIRALEEQETDELPDLSEIMFDSDVSAIPNKFIYNNIKSRVFNK